MFTVAHELAHVFVGEEGVSAAQSLLPSDHEVETLCDGIAAEFLVPEAELREFWPHVSGRSDRYQQTAQHFKVSRVVAARRALDMELIDRDTFFEFTRKTKPRAAPTGQTRREGIFGIPSAGVSGFRSLRQWFARSRRAGCPIVKRTR